MNIFSWRFFNTPSRAMPTPYVVEEDHCFIHAHACVQSCQTLCDPTDCDPMNRLLCPWDFPGKNIGVGCSFLLQGDLPTQGLNPRFLCLLHGQVDSLPLSHLGSSVLFIKNTQSSWGSSWGTGMFESTQIWYLESRISRDLCPDRISNFGEL